MDKPGRGRLSGERFHIQDARRATQGCRGTQGMSSKVFSMTIKLKLSSETNFQEKDL